MIEVKSVKVKDLTPYEKNPRKNDDAVEAVAESIKLYGFKVPIVADSAGVIITGHTRLKAAKLLGMKEVPVIYADDLTEEQARAFRLVDNKTGELAGWDYPLLMEELDGLDFGGFDFGFEGLHFWGEDNQEGSEEYDEFLEKFEQKKTTDDCFTPANIYEVIKTWAVKEYHLEGLKILRPFYPGGDYEHEEYPADCVVLDNPPFSILSEICRFYQDRGVRFFLFAPALTLFSTCAGELNYIGANVGITYDNGATVNTGFVTNLGPWKIDNAPELQELVAEQDKINQRELHKELPRYEYPSHVVTPAQIARLARYGQRVRIKGEAASFVRSLESQKEQGKAIYGGGFLLDDKAAEMMEDAEKQALVEKLKEKEVEAAQVWALSPSEREVIKKLNKKAKEERG